MTADLNASISIRFIGPGHRVGQDRFSRHDVEQLSRHERSEAFDGPAIRPDPLRMGARHADDRVARRVDTQRAEQLGLFAPHDVRRLAVALRYPWEDPDVTILSRNHDGVLEDRCELRRRVDISGFNPSLSGAGHAADDDGQLMRGAVGLQMRLQHGREANLARRHHALVAAPFPEDVASPVDEPKPKTARAPIDRDICSLFHFNPARMQSRAAATSYHADLAGEEFTCLVRRSLCS